MPDDLNCSFAEIFPNPRDLKRQMVEILPYIQDRKYEAVPYFTFLSIERADEKISEATTVLAQSLGVDRPFPEESVSTDDEDEASWKKDKEGQHCRTYSREDVDDPTLRLTLVRTRDRMYSTLKQYLAVSYCWPSLENSTHHLGSLNLPVSIKETEGNTRPARAPPHIIRRAIRHAADLRLKYIWLDQECINQTDPEEKEASIQCMDHVYRNAGQVLCLLHLHIDDQDRIDLLETLHYHNRHGVRNQFDSMGRHLGGLRGSPQLATLLAGILSEVAADRWFTRAWIMHERLCSSNLESTGVWASISADLQSDVPGEICILGLDQLADAHEIAFRLDHGDHRDELREDKQTLWEEYGQKECLAAAALLQEAIKRFESAYKLVRPAAIRRRLAESRRYFYSPLQTTHNLASLGCFVPSDKIAMLANTCQWSKRLDTRQVLNRGWSFSLCVWMLAIANGDGSFICQEDKCNTNGLIEDAWAPSAETNISLMYCSGLLDHVSMDLKDEGLETHGWLWQVDRFIDLSELVPVIEAIERDVPETENSAWVNYEFKTYPVEDKATKLKEFFWALLLKLFELEEFDVANLVWEAAKLRCRGGWHGRTLVSFPISTFDKIVDPEGGRYIGCYESLGIANEEQYDSYSSEESFASEVVRYLQRSCEHCRQGWHLRKSLEGSIDSHGETVDEPEEHQSEGDPKALPPPSHVLLGGEEQLAGIGWIRDAILDNGGLSVGALVQGEPLPTATRPDDVNLRAQERPAELKLALLRCRRSVENNNHVFTLHREVRKYKQGDGKALYMVHSFDVWLRDAASHTDAPFCWNAERRGENVCIRSPSNALFDIGGLRRSKYVLGWPGVYHQERWSL